MTVPIFRLPLFAAQEKNARRRKESRSSEVFFMMGNQWAGIRQQERRSEWHSITSHINKGRRRLESSSSPTNTHFNQQFNRPCFDRKCHYFLVTHRRVTIFPPWQLCSGSRKRESDNSKVFPREAFWHLKVLVCWQRGAFFGFTTVTNIWCYPVY